MLQNTSNSFGFVTRFFHWLMSFMIICLLCVGFYMVDLPNSPSKFEIYGLHKSTGVIVLSLLCFRLLWRFMNITPTLPSTMPNWQVLAYKFGVFVMYCCMVAMPVSVMLMSLYNGRDISIYGLFTINGFEKNEFISHTAWQMHGIIAPIFACFISIHILVSLYHHFIDKDRLLMRMIKGE